MFDAGLVATTTTYTTKVYAQFQTLLSECTLTSVHRNLIGQCWFEICKGAVCFCKECEGHGLVPVP